LDGLKNLLEKILKKTDGVLYSVFDDYGFGNVSSPVACTAIDVGDLDVTITRD